MKTKTRKNSTTQKRSTKRKSTLRGVKGSTNYTKKDLVKAVAKSTKVTQKEAEAVINSSLEQIRNMANDGNLTLQNFGSFRVKHRAYKHPKTKRSGVSSKVGFTASKNLTKKSSKATSLKIKVSR